MKNTRWGKCSAVKRFSRFEAFENIDRTNRFKKGQIERGTIPPKPKHYIKGSRSGWFYFDNNLLIAHTGTIHSKQNIKSHLEVSPITKFHSSVKNGASYKYTSSTSVTRRLTPYRLCTVSYKSTSQALASNHQGTSVCTPIVCRFTGLYVHNHSCEIYRKTCGTIRLDVF